MATIEAKFAFDLPVCIVPAINLHKCNKTIYVVTASESK